MIDTRNNLETYPKLQTLGGAAGVAVAVAGSHGSATVVVSAMVTLGAIVGAGVGFLFGCVVYRFINPIGNTTENCKNTTKEWPKTAIKANEVMDEARDILKETKGCCSQLTNSASYLSRTGLIFAGMAMAGGLYLSESKCSYFVCENPIAQATHTGASLFITTGVTVTLYRYLKSS